MAYIEPFRAFRFDPARVSLDHVVTQPYDKITPAMQEQYYAASPHNLVRIILGKRSATDTAEDNVYSRAAKFFSDWRNDGVLVQDPEPSIYRYSQEFTAPNGTKMVRDGFIAAGKLQDYSQGVVHRHEQTLSKPKADRLDLLRATRAHFGHIFMLYSDPEAEIERTLNLGNRATIDVNDEFGVRHQVWKTSDQSVIAHVQGKMSDKKLIIADGHHRYETALTYRRERQAAVGSPEQAPASHDFAMMTFVNMDSPGLLILPTHRVVHSLPEFSMEKLHQGAREFFSVEEVDPGLDAKRATAILKEAAHTGTSLLGVSADRAFLFSRPKAPAAVFEGYSLLHQGLDVVQLHKCLLEQSLGISEEAIRNQQNIAYVREADEALERARSGRANVSFLMNPVGMREVRDIAFAGEVMPQKSTDFYPKLLDGLAIYALD
ncbi:MAG TPA: DUF1015 domain-containing protein [Terriglobales bacterium]|jgi:uncharacterized protein (DUF1015 family)|nr:DUF1015 domain-containing protein [Terriglobales bacterium]